jgi:hypothetical protein
MLLPLASLSDVIPLAATADAIAPFLLFFRRHPFANVFDNRRQSRPQAGSSKTQPEGWPLGYKKAASTYAKQ